MVVDYYDDDDDDDDCDVDSDDVETEGILHNDGNGDYDYGEDQARPQQNGTEIIKR